MSEQKRERTPKTRSMPHGTLPDLTEWAMRQKKFAPDDTGSMPPPPPQDTPEPLERGTAERTEG
jgi:hypothetical protein